MHIRIASHAALLLSFVIAPFLSSPQASAGENDTPRPLPGELESAELAGFEDFDPKRAALVDLALKLGRTHRLNRYLFGSADPEKGGFDCSGSIYFILSQAGIEPARSSAAQYDWIDDAGLLTQVPASASSLDSPVFEKLQPGDLVFWAGTYRPTDGRTNKVTHVQMYLGVEKASGKPVMIGSSDGRSYSGKARCGFGVYDFKVPGKQSKARIVGFGPPPGLEKLQNEPKPSTGP